MVHSSRPLRSALQKFFPRIGPVSDYFLGACTSIPRSLWEQFGGHALRCGVRGRCSLRNGTLAFEAAVAGLGTGRKCAFGATIGNCCKSTLRPGRNSANMREARSWTQHASAMVLVALRPLPWRGSLVRRGAVPHERGRGPARCYCGKLRRPRGISDQ